jgi:hypothetical protein
MNDNWLFVILLILFFGIGFFVGKSFCDKCETPPQDEQLKIKAAVLESEVLRLRSTLPALKDTVVKVTTLRHEIQPTVNRIRLNFVATDTLPAY